MSIESELVVPSELEFRLGCRGGLATVAAEIEKRLAEMPSKPKPGPLSAPEHARQLDVLTRRLGSVGAASLALAMTQALKK